MIIGHRRLCYDRVERLLVLECGSAWSLFPSFDESVTLDTYTRIPLCSREYQDKRPHPGKDNGEDGGWNLKKTSEENRRGDPGWSE